MVRTCSKPFSQGKQDVQSVASKAAAEAVDVLAAAWVMDVDVAAAAAADDLADPAALETGATTTAEDEAATTGLCDAEEGSSGQPIARWERGRRREKGQRRTPSRK